MRKSKIIGNRKTRYDAVQLIEKAIKQIDVRDKKMGKYSELYNLVNTTKTVTQ